METNPTCFFKAPRKIIRFSHPFNSITWLVMSISNYQLYKVRYPIWPEKILLHKLIPTAKWKCTNIVDVFSLFSWEYVFFIQFTNILTSIQGALLSTAKFCYIIKNSCCYFTDIVNSLDYFLAKQYQGTLLVVATTLRIEIVPSIYLVLLLTLVFTYCIVVFKFNLRKVNMFCGDLLR